MNCVIYNNFVIREFDGNYWEKEWNSLGYEKHFYLLKFGKFEKYKKKYKKKLKKLIKNVLKKFITKIKKKIEKKFIEEQTKTKKIEEKLFWKNRVEKVL